jgi:hypothetical protein
MNKLFIIIIPLLFGGCVSNKGAKEVRIAIPALFELRMEYYEDEESEMSIGPDISIPPKT